MKAMLKYTFASLKIPIIVARTFPDDNLDKKF